MLRLFYGTNRKKARDAMSQSVEKLGKKRVRVTITDAHTVDDLRTALSGGGMFAVPSTVVLDSTLQNEEMRQFVLGSLPRMQESDDLFFMLEEKVDAATKKLVEKHAEDSQKFDLPAGRQARNDAFAIAMAMRRADKKGAWVALQRELIAGKAPEAIHGILFWAAKDMLLKARSAPDTARARALVAELAELPHTARRQGFDLDSALELFILRAHAR